MHVLIGLVGLAAILAYIITGGHGAFTGVIHPPSLLLLGAAPLCMALVSYRVNELRQAAIDLWAALRFDAPRSRAELYDALTRFASELRGRKAAAALEISDRSSNDLLRQLGPLVVRQYASDELERTASTATYVTLSELRRSEDVFHTLARVAPATGLIGTVLGLINLLKDLSKFEQLGPSMALALLCTLYGLLLANAVYQPLARRIRAHAIVVAEEARLCTRGLALTVEGKPLADIRKLFEGQAGTAAAPAPNLAIGGQG